MVNGEFNEVIINRLNPKKTTL